MRLIDQVKTGIFGNLKQQINIRCLARIAARVRPKQVEGIDPTSAQLRAGIDNCRSDLVEVHGQAIAE